MQRKATIRAKPNGGIAMCKNRLTKILCAGALLHMAALLAMASAFAYADDSDATDAIVEVSADYSEDITPQNGDVFSIIYCIPGEASETAEITLDASELVAENGVMNLVPGKYEIADIEYRGYNKEINRQGYAVSKYIEADDERTAEVQLAIGTEAGRRLSSMRADLVIKKQGERVYSFDEIDDGWMTVPLMEQVDLKGENVVSAETDPGAGEEGTAEPEEEAPEEIQEELPNEAGGETGQSVKEEPGSEDIKEPEEKTEAAEPEKESAPDIQPATSYVPQPDYEDDESFIESPEEAYASLSGNSSARQEADSLSGRTENRTGEETESNTVNSGNRISPRSLLKRGIPLICVAVIGGIVLFIIYKKNILD